VARLVLVHGFTQTARSWDPLLPALADHEVVAFDAPGHGGNAHVRADLAHAGALLAEHGPATYIGYSMGGRMCLHVPPTAMTGLVLISATAGIDDDAERAARRQSDEALADRIEVIGTDAFLEEWLAMSMFAGLRERGARSTDAAGMASSLRLAGTGTQLPRWDRLHEIACPVLVVAGERDEKFVSLAHRLHAGLPDSTLAIVPDAGHTVHLEQPDAFLDVLTRWLTR
jgi:2-succinyl-6-hydroxy-2,4-cyclohexadiene-1-carboxylate synthase